MNSEKCSYLRKTPTSSPIREAEFDAGNPLQFENNND